MLTVAAALFAALQTPEEKLRAQVEALKPSRLAWAEIPWLNCPLKALAQSRRDRKPVVCWIFGGNPSDERC